MNIILHKRAYLFCQQLVACNLLHGKKYAKIKSGSTKGSKEVVGTLTKDQIREIAETKLPDLNCYTVEEAIKIVEGTARNMGVKVAE